MDRMKLKSQDGWVIVTAMLVMMIMLMIGLALTSIADTQSKGSGAERVRETSFNLGEGVLSAQQVVLQNNWPSKPPCTPTASDCGYPVQCTYSNGALTAGLAAKCPAPSELIGTGKAFGSSDISTAKTRFEVQVRDNIGSSVSTYNQSVVNAANGCGTGVQCTWDSNGDNKLWVRVDAWSQYSGDANRLPKKRSMVALLQLESISIPFAKNAVTGGSTSFSNSGNKVLVDATGSQVVVRCSPYPGSSLATQSLAGVNAVTVNSIAGFAANMTVVIGSGTTAEFRDILAINTLTKIITFKTPLLSSTHAAGAPIYQAPPNKDINGNNCQGWDSSKGPQVNPKSSFISQSDYPPVMSASTVEALARGPGVNVYRDTCPSPTDPTAWSGKVIVLSTTNAIVNCSMQFKAVINPTTPGYVIIQRGTLNFQSAGIEYHGLIYMQNLMGYGASDPFVITMGGNPTIYGGIAVDGFGNVQIGSGSGNEPSVVYDPTPFDNFTATGAAGLIQNTWRELDPGQ